MIADIILKGNCIFTGLKENAEKGFVAIKDNKIIAVEKDWELIPSFQGEATKVLEYEDKLIMAGMCDAHMHFNSGVTQNSPYTLTELVNARNEADCVEMLKAFIAKYPDLDKIIGRGWMTEKWTQTELPTKESLDAVVPDKPVYFSAADGHTSWLNTKALESLEIPEGYKSINDIHVDENGEWTGIVAEEAHVDLIYPIGSALNEKTKVEDTEFFIDSMLARGLTCCCDLTGIYEDEDYSALDQLAAEDRLKIRINYTIGLVREEDGLRQRHKKEHHSPMFGFTSLKGGIDGVRATYTAMLLEPYIDKPDCDGTPPSYVDSYEDFERMVIAANAEGYGVRSHSVGDLATRWCLDAYEKGQAQLAPGEKKFRNTVEHMETVGPDDIPRFKELDVVASVQPFHMYLDEATPRVGVERSRWQWPLRSLLDAGAVLAFGTDHPIVTYDPFEEIYFAVTRCDHDGNLIGSNDNERITLAEALRAYTYGSAYAECREEELGTLEVGKLADITVLDKNLFDVPVSEILNTRAVLTIVDGKIVYTA